MNSVILKSRTVEHVKVFWEKTRDKELESLFPFYRTTLDKAIDMYNDTLKPNANSFGQVIYVDDKYIGDIWCYGIDDCTEKLAFLSIVIFDKAYWGKGIGTYVLNLFCKTVFKRYSIDKLCAFTFTDNLKSRRALERVGFVLIEEFAENGKSSCYYEYRKIKKLTLVELTEEYAKAISEWKYEGDYSIYNYPSWDIMCNQKWAITIEEKRKKEFFAVTDEVSRLSGFIRLQDKSREVLIGLGLKPCLCGYGLGDQLLDLIKEKCHQIYPFKNIILEVRSFNERAINCYKKAGFMVIDTFERDSIMGPDFFIRCVQDKY